MKAKLIKIREYQVAHIGACATIKLVDELLEELDSEELVERVAVAINRARVIRPMPNDLAQAAINAIKGDGV